MNTYKVEIKWAFIFTAMMLIWMLLERLAGLHSTHIDKHMYYSNFVAIPAIAIYLLALLDKRKTYYGGLMTYKQGFKAGIIITIIVTALSPLAQIITSTVITPDFFSNMSDFAVAQKDMTREEAEASFNLKSYIFYMLIGTPVMGFITTVVVAFFTKRGE